jgi:hypothetical protein
MVRVLATKEKTDAKDETEARMRAVLDWLMHERQELRRSGVDRATLEANRLAIVYWQQALSIRRPQV